MSQGYIDFLKTWNQWLTMLTYVMLVIAALITLYYLFGVITRSDPKKRYDFINLYEIKLFWYTMLTLSVAGGLYLNTLFNATVSQETIWFFVRLFVVASFTTIFALIFNSLIKVYYPFYVQRKLNRLRHKPRKNPANGNELKLMSEDEEDEYLTDEMIKEESSHTVDYDVWLDEETGFTKIEKYDGAQMAIECPSCGYRTLHVVQEEVIRTPTLEEEGEILNYYNCSYCGHKERRTIKTRKLHQRPEVA